MADGDFVYDRVAGCLLGMAAGEALGLPAAGMSPWGVTRKFQFIDGFFPQRPGDSGCGSYGDGSRFVLNMASATHGSPAMSREVVSSAYASMAGKVGGSWGEAALAASQGPVQDRVSDGLMSPDACMAGVPVGLWAALSEAPSDIDVLKACKLVLSPAHGFKPCALAAFVVAYAIKDCIRNSKSLSGKAEMFERDMSLMSRITSLVRRAAESLAGDEREPGMDLAARLDFARKSLQVGRGVAEFVGMHGNSADAMECAVFSLFCFMRSPDDFKSVSSAASMGGAAGTNAAMVGAMCGAYSGLQFIPGDVQRGVENYPRILALAEEMSGKKKA